MLEVDFKLLSVSVFLLDLDLVVLRLKSKFCFSIGLLCLQDSSSAFERFCTPLEYEHCTSKINQATTSKACAKGFFFRKYGLFVKSPKRNPDHYLLFRRRTVLKLVI